MRWELFTLWRLRVRAVWRLPPSAAIGHAIDVTPRKGGATKLYTLCYWFFSASIMRLTKNMMTKDNCLSNCRCAGPLNILLTIQCVNMYYSNMYLWTTSTKIVVFVGSPLILHERFITSLKSNRYWLQFKSNSNEMTDNSIWKRYNKRVYLILFCHLVVKIPWAVEEASIGHNKMTSPQAEVPAVTPTEWQKDWNVNLHIIICVRYVKFWGKISP